jgi:molybdopterin/thiamine biosynthesis adenylyltransferase
MFSEPFIVLTLNAARLIRNSKSRRGAMRMHRSPAVDAFVIDQIETSPDVRVPVVIPAEFRSLNYGDETFRAQWMQSDNVNLTLLHVWLSRRPSGTYPLDKFRQLVPNVEDPGGKVGLLITRLALRNKAEELPEFVGWQISRDGITPLPLQVEPASYGAAQLSEAWPTQQLARNSVAIVGAGSIGGHAALAISELGLGRLVLIDPDRLLWHNLVRHRLDLAGVGASKVSGLRETINRRTIQSLPEYRTSVEAHALDVVARAEVFAELLADVDLVLCTADGIAPRRVVSHLARLAGKPAVMACVLNDGGIGEILRLRPGSKFGCLLCQRAALSFSGAMDAEADQELAYGTGLVHKPMTATPHDLSLVGNLAAKVTIATLLESLHGDATQQLPGEQALLGLRPDPGLAPPFDLKYAGELRWDSIPPARAGCPTCSIG